MRFKTAIAIGSGGIGEVFKAWDTDLHRFVALKYLRHESPVLVDRLKREARAQARTDHPHVCKVYEVGDDNGRPFIAMQYIDGEPLHLAAAEMSVEQKVALLKVNGEAVHEAHVVGLVHRDLKPGNILVEQSDDGGFHPYVVDFGLVREHEVQGLTRTGEVLGTPSYMAPEQARGDSRNTDRRSDVYALGAVLFEMLGGRPPFEGDSSVEILMQVIDHEPPRLCRINPATPEDLEAVALKCLEKDPKDRYESARAFAEDLDRYLAGEPVYARRPSWVGRGLRLAKRRPIAATAVAAATGLCLSLASVAVHARWSAAETARLAQRFGQEVEQVQAQLRFDSMLPAHDMQPAWERARRQMVDISEVVSRTGGRAIGPGNVALAQGHSALGDFEQARAFIDRAWDAEYRHADAALVRGRIYAELFRKEKLKLARIKDTELRGQQAVEIARALREPALVSLHRADEAGFISPSYVRGLLALLENKPGDALRHARQAKEELPWLYEAALLEGDVLMQEVSGIIDGGQSEQAFEELQRAASVFEEAVSIAPSNSAGYLRLVELWATAVFLAVNFELPPDQYLENAVLWAERARVFEPERAEVAAAAAGALSISAGYKLDRGGDPLPLIKKAQNMCREGLVSEPERAELIRTFAGTYRLSAEYAMDHGQDPLGHFEQSASWYRKAVEIDAESFESLNGLGVLHERWAFFRRSKGEPALVHLEKASSLLERATSIRPYWMTLGNLSTIYMRIAEASEDAGAKGAALEKASAAGERALQSAPDNPRLLVNAANTAYVQGAHQRDAEIDPMPAWQSGVAHLEKAASLAPDMFRIHYSLGLTSMAMARFHVGRGQDPIEDFERARAAYARAVETNPEHPIVLYGYANACFALAEHRVSRNQDPDELIDESLQFQKRALEIDADNPWANEGLAEVSLLAAELEIERGRYPRQLLDQIDETTRRLRLMNQQGRKYLLYEGRAGVLRARSLKAAGRPSRNTALDAAAVFDSYLETNPTDKDAMRSKQEAIALAGCDDVAVAEES